MNASYSERIAIAIDDRQQVSGLLLTVPSARACYVFGHGAGAGMEHAFMEAIANALADRGIATLRYQFPYMEQGSKRPDVPKIAHAVVRAAVGEAARRLPALALFAGGKSYGGRMTSQAQASAPLPGVVGLVFLGFPLHPARKPGVERSRHLLDVEVPSLFLQGTRDELADLVLMQSVVKQLGARATLRLFDDADHSFHVRKSSGHSDSEVMFELADTLAAWIHACLDQAASTGK